MAFFIGAKEIERQFQGFQHRFTLRLSTVNLYLHIFIFAISINYISGVIGPKVMKRVKYTMYISQGGAVSVSCSQQPSWWVEEMGLSRSR